MEKVNGSVTRTTGIMTERETMEAFVDGAKMASSASRELMKDPLPRSKIQIFTDFMAGINNMIAGCGQMTSAHRLNPKFIALRDMLHLVRDAAQKEILIDKNPGWRDIADVLDSICRGGQQLANMKSMSRLETLMAANIKADPKKFIN